MIDGGAAIMGSATATGPDRAEIAAREAINSPLLDGVSIRGARNVLVNISAGPNLGMRETTTAASIIQQEAGDEAEIILGTVLDESFEDELRVTVIATGFELSQDRTQAKVAPNKTTESMSKPKSAGLPKASDIARRHSNTLDGPFYKGEKNLKNLDSPAIHRRDLKYIRHTEEAVEADDDFSESIQQERKKASNDDTLLNDRSERIDKRDSEQPAFLRKIMD
jgi:cell division protein FtsZ